MAEEERLTKAERRRQRREQQQASSGRSREQLRGRLLRGAGAVVVIGLVGAIVWLALAGGGSGLGEAVELTASAVTDARSSASCEVVDQSTDFNRDHFDSPQQAPPPGQLYSVRPSHGGRHLGQIPPPITTSDQQLSEVATTHNLEHGSVIVWYDPAKVDGGTVEQIEEWSEALDESGFTNSRAGVAVSVSPFTEPGLGGDKAVAMRAWGIAIDCGAWNETAANGFVAQYYGPRGIAPEASLAGSFPEDTLVWSGEPLDNGFGAGGG